MPISIMETIDKIQVGNLKSDLVAVKSSLRQDDSMLPILFNLVLEKVISEVIIEPQECVNFHDSVVIVLAYTHDIVKIKESQTRLKLLFNRFNDAAR